MRSAAKHNGIAIAEPAPANMLIVLGKTFGGGMNMSMLRKICSALLLFSLLALGGCPEMAQQGGSSSGDSSGGGRGGMEQ
jgi:hypothetical protein